MVMSGVSAQVEKGKILLGGTTAFSYSSMTLKFEYDGEEFDEMEMKMADLTFSPILGYFVMDGLAVGLDLNYTSSKAKIGDGDWSDPSTELGASLFGRYYFGSGNFKPFGHAQVGFMSMSDSDADEDKYSGLVYGLGLGADYFLNDNVALELGISYNMGKIKNKADDLEVIKPGVLSFGIGVFVTIGN